MGQVRLRSERSKGGARRQPASTRHASRFQTGAVTRGARSVSLRARSFDATTRQFEFVLASETPCRTYRIDRNWNFVEVEEVLPMAALTSLTRVNGWPLLDCHNSWSVHDVLGRITALRVEGTQLIGSAFLSDRDDVAGIARDLETGVLCEFSVGFDIDEDGEVTEREGKPPLVTIKRWSVREGSLVPLPADATASMRMSARSLSHARASGGPGAVRSLITAANGNRSMKTSELTTLIEGLRSATTALVTGLEAVVAEAEADETEDDLEAQAEAAAQRARDEVLAKRSAPPAPVVPAVVPAKTAGGRSAEEIAHVSKIRSTVEKFGLEKEFDIAEKAGASIDTLCGFIAAGLRTNSTEIDGTVQPGAEPKTVKDVKFENTRAGRKAAARK